MGKLKRKNRKNNPSFWRNAEQDANGCWIWQGCRRTPTNGVFVYGTFKSDRAHRVAWELCNGPISDGLFVCHKCDVPLCINPEHLFLGTTRDNALDMKTKRRHAFGERHPSNKLTDLQVLAIREKYRPSQRWKRTGTSFEDLAKEFGVSDTLIGDIIKGNRHKLVHV